MISSLKFSVVVSFSDLPSDMKLLHRELSQVKIERDELLLKVKVSSVSFIDFDL